MPFSNGIRTEHVLVLGVFLLVRHAYGKSSAASGSGSSDEGSDNEHEEHEEGFVVFHMDFKRVESYFLLAMWVFIGASLKIFYRILEEARAFQVFPESCLMITAGIVLGIVMQMTSGEVMAVLEPDPFFLILLPPIILEAGYFMPNRLFFDHIGTILLMAVVGTVFNMFTVGSALYACGLTGIYTVELTPNLFETFLFASLIVAVDPVAVLAVFEEIHVDEILYIVVFGESLLNDAVTVVLYNMFDEFIAIGIEDITPYDIGKGLFSFLVVALGGVLVGVLGGFFTGLITRFTHHVRSIEALFVIICAYLTYLIAEIFHLSGILAMTFCGITMKNYVHANISPSSRLTLKYMIKMLAHVMEMIVFIFLGISSITNDHIWNWPFVFFTILFCSVFRAIGVVFLTAFANQYRLHKLKSVDQFVMAYGGLRGAIAFALVSQINGEMMSPKKKNMFVATTIAVVFWTVFVQGVTIKPLVKLLNVKTASEKDPNMNERIAGRLIDNVTSGIEGVLGSMSHRSIRDFYKRIDGKYIKPLLVRDPHPDPKIEETFHKMVSQSYDEMIQSNPSGVMRAISDEHASNGSRTVYNAKVDQNGFASQEGVSTDINVVSLHVPTLQVNGSPSKDSGK